MNPRGRLFAPLFGLASLCLAGNASAYCRTHTCDSSKTACERDLNFCIVSGKPLTWPTSCIGWTVQANGSPALGISADALEKVTKSAFDTWLGADCGGGRRPALSIENMGQVECDRTEYNQDQGNANIFMFRDEDWPPGQGDHALAVTTLWFNPESGMIYDVDVEINGTMAITTTGAAGSSDLQSILTHEIGHFLGLSHSMQSSSVMRTHYTGNMRTLHADDIAGICSIYTPDRSVKTDSCSPRHGFATTCSSSADSGCSFSSRASATSLGWLAPFVAGALAWRRRRSRAGGNADGRR